MSPDAHYQCSLRVLRDSSHKLRNNEQAQAVSLSWTTQGMPTVQAASVWFTVQMNLCAVTVVTALTCVQESDQPERNMYSIILLKVD